MGPNVHFIESKNKEFRPVQMEMEDRHSGRVVRYLLIEEGKEVPHHYKDGPRQGQEEFADVKRPLIEIIYSYRQKRTWSGSFRLPHLKQNTGCWLGVRHLISAQVLISGSWVQALHLGSMLGLEPTEHWVSNFISDHKQSLAPRWDAVVSKTVNKRSAWVYPHFWDYLLWPATVFSDCLGLERLSVF